MSRPRLLDGLVACINAHLEQLLVEVLVIELPELAEAELAEVGEEDPALPLDLALHVHHLLLRGADAERVQRLQQVLAAQSKARTIISGSFWTYIKA